MLTEVFFRKIKTKVNAIERCGSSAYYKCQWPVSRSVYLWYRWLHFLTLSAALLISLLSREDGLPGRWLIFLTNWSLLLDFVIAGFSLQLVRTATAAHQKGEPIKISAKVLETYGWLHSTSIVVALGVSVIYWSFVYDPEIHQLDYVNLLVHAGNSGIMLLDLFLVAHPVKLINIIFPPLFTFVYTVFNILYFLCGGTDRKGNHYVYKVIDWTKPMHATLFVLGGMFLLMIILIVIWLLAALRRKIAVCLKRKMHEIIPQQDQAIEITVA